MSASESQVMERVTDGSEAGANAFASGSSASTQPDSASSIINDYAADQHAARQVTASQPDQPQSEPSAAPPGTEPQPDQSAAEVAQVDDPVPVPESRIAPLFQLGSLSDEEAFPQAVDVVRSLAVDDPIHYRLLANAVLDVSPTAIRNAVLSRMGVPAEKVQEFMAWTNSGAPELPKPETVLPFEQTVQKIEPGEYGANWVRLADGRELNLDNPDDKDRYEVARFRHDFELKEKTEVARKAAEEAETQRVADEQAAIQAQQDITSRTDTYMAARTSLANSLIDDAVKNLSADESFMGKMFKAFALDQISNNPDILKAGREVKQHVEGGYGFTKGQDGSWQLSGRVADLAKEQDRITRITVNALKDSFNKELLRRNRAELAATSNQPVIPDNAKTVTSAAPQPDNYNPLTDSRASIIDDYRRDIAAMRG